MKNKQVNKLLRALHIFLWSLFILSTATTFLNLFPIGLNFNNSTLSLAVFGSSSLLVILNFNHLKRLYFHSLSTVHQRKKFFNWSVANIALLALFLVIYALFQYGSPLVYEEHLGRFYPEKTVWLVNNQVVRQEFSASSDKLGTMGVQLAMKEALLAIEDGEVLEIEVEEIEEVKEEALLLADEEFLEDDVWFFPQPLELEFRIKEAGQDEWLAVNQYQFEKVLEDDFFQFGFPTIDDSAEKKYVFELEGKNQVNNTTHGVFLAVETTQDQKINYFHRYVYVRGDIRSSISSIYDNIATKFNQVLKRDEASLLLVAHFLLSLAVMISALKGKGFEKAIKASFLGYFALIALNSFLQIYTRYQLFDNIFSTYSILITAVLGSILLYLNQDRLTRESERQTETEKSTELKRRQEFKNKYPTINKVPLLKNMVRWMYQEGWKYSLGLLAVILLGVVVFSYNIGHDFREDEYQVVGAAAGYYHTSEYYVWDWLGQKQGKRLYTRAWPHTWLIAQSFRIFGISEWSARIVSVVFGLIFLTSVYFTSKYFWKDKKLSLLIAFSYALNPAFITIFRYTRMYAVLLPIFLLLFYCLYRGITESNKIDFKLKWLNQLINKYLDFNWIFLLLALPLLYFNYHIHINSLVILPSLLLFAIYLAFSEKNPKYILLTIFGFLSLIICYRLGVIDRFSAHLSLMGRVNSIYLNYLSNFPVGVGLGISYLVLGFISLFVFLKQKNKELAYFYSLILFSAIFFIWFADRYAGFLYISHIVPISILLIFFLYLALLKIFNLKKVKILLSFFLIFSVLLGFINRVQRLYGTRHGYGNYSEAYQIIIDNYNPEKEVLFGQYARAYYLRELGDDLKGISLLKNRQYKFEDFLEELSKYEAGWVTWETRKGYHIRGEIRSYVDNNFVKHHGRDVDESNVEIYYFEKSMLE